MKWFKSLTEIEALDRELERLHNLRPLLKEPSDWDKAFERSKEIEGVLITIAKKTNGLEY